MDADSKFVEMSTRIFPKNVLAKNIWELFKIQETKNSQSMFCLYLSWKFLNPFPRVRNQHIYLQTFARFKIFDRI
jgi:hypothetical protein